MRAADDDRHVELREIDYAEVLRERKGGSAADWEEVIANCLQGDVFDLDEDSVRALLEVAGDPEKLEELIGLLDARAAEGGKGTGQRAAGSGTPIGSASVEPPALAAGMAVPGQKVSPDDETAWVCPMHPDYTSEKPGTCPRCGMDLVLGTPFDMRDYRLDFDTVPEDGTVHFAEDIYRLDTVLDLSAGYQALAHATTDHDEAVQAFIEKRDPVFTGE